MSYRDDVAALAARKAALDQQLKDLTTERDETARMLEQVRLPVLPNMRVAAPCDAKWDDMTGDDRARHCGECKQQVFNLSALTTEQAESLIREKHGDLCVRYYKRKDGTVLTADCSVGTKKRERRRTIFASAVAVSLFGAGASYTRADAARHEREAVMGKFAVERSSCDVYLDQLHQLAQCAPTEESRQEIRNTANQFVMAMHQASPETEAQIQNACGQIVELMKPTLDATCNHLPPMPGAVPLEQRDDDRGQNR